MSKNNCNCQQWFADSYVELTLNIKGLKKSKLTIWSLAQPKYAEEYIAWFVKTHGRATATLWQRIVAMRSIANYLEITAPTKQGRAKAALLLREIKLAQSRIPRIETVRDKKNRWLSLEQIESVGQSLYPLSDTRIEEYGAHRNRSIHKALEGGKVSNHSYKRNAVLTGQSLLLRLMVRLPMRQRNYREMCWNPRNPAQGKNLFRDGDKWFVKFSGEELKIGFRRGKVNSIVHQVPQELYELLEEYLTKWRPLLTGLPYSFATEVRASYKESEITRAPSFKKAPNDVHLFLNELGRPATERMVTAWVEKATYKFTGIAVNPHMVRDIWATTYIKRTKDFVGAAKRLGDLVETTLKHYSHLLDEEAEENANAFNDSIFGIYGNRSVIKGRVNETTENLIQFLELKRKLLKAGVSEEELIKLLKST